MDAGDIGALIDHAKRLLAEQPRTRAELGRLLAEHRPDTDPGTLAFAATHHIALCHVVLPPGLKAPPGARMLVFFGISGYIGISSS
jgi:hypothetical protein